ncbi:MAG TPA: protein kinase, partial [Pirellulales bacterium]
MPTACPHCHEPIESTGLSLRSCGHCGGILPRAVAASDITIDYVPGGAEPDSPPIGTASTLVLHDQDRRVGDYRLVRSLGEGGMGIVWEAEQAGTGRRVALKLISPRLQPTPETVERFLREGQLAASVSHPRSTFVFGAGQQDGQPYIAMELMPGQTLKDLLDRDGPLPVERAVDYVLDVIDGLEAAHAQGVVHRDVKPSNCFLDTEGRVKVGDFGLSKSLIADSELTRSGAFLGTPQFAAPEQVRGGAATPATDGYAVGATLFCLLTGRGPFVGEAAAVIAQIISDRAPPLRTLRSDAPRTLERVVARTLAKEPARRFADLTQLRQALAPFATRGSSIAYVGRRLAAYMFDEIVLSLVMTTALVAILTAVMALSNHLLRGILANDPHRVVAYIQIVEVGLMVGYFAFFESRWGCGLGKRLLGLRVVGPNGEPPDYARSLLRAVFVPGALGLPLLTPILSLLRVSDPTVSVAGLDVTKWLPTIAPTAFTLLCMVTMRSRNGNRGLHELVSGTRVVTPQRTAAARRRRLPVMAPVVASSIAFGPFRVTGKLGMSGSSSVW